MKSPRWCDSRLSDNSWNRGTIQMRIANQHKYVQMHHWTTHIETSPNTLRRHKSCWSFQERMSHVVIMFIADWLTFWFRWILLCHQGCKRNQVPLCWSLAWTKTMARNANRQDGWNIDLIHEREQHSAKGFFQTAYWSQPNTQLR